MIFNCIIIALAGLFLVLSIISAVTEEMNIKKASVRNFFRRIRLTVREITIVKYIIAVLLTLWLASKLSSSGIVPALCASGIFTIGVVISEYYLIFFRRKAVKWQKPMTPMTQLPETPLAKEAPPAKIAAELKPAQQKKIRRIK